MPARAFPTAVRSSKRDIANRSARVLHAKDRRAKQLRSYLQFGCRPLLTGAICEADIERQLALAMERSTPEQAASLSDHVDNLESFARYLRRNRAWLKRQLANKNGPQ